MTKWTRMMSTAITMTTAAVEEANRLGSPQIDLEHLFLGAVLNGDSAGQLLREHGITIESARDAIEEIRAEQLSGLGIQAPKVPPRELRPAHEAQFDWTPRANDVLKDVKSPYDTLSTLRALLDEPSGTIKRIVEHLGVDYAELRQDAHDASSAEAGDHDSAAPKNPNEGNAITVTGFVPAPLEDVWALVVDPARSPEWNEFVMSVEPQGPDTWRVTPARRTRRSGTKPGKPVVLRRIATDAQNHSITSEHTWPRTPRAAAHLMTVTLSPSGDGTAVELRSSFGRSPSMGRRLIRRVLSPLLRFGATMMLSQELASLSRHFRAQAD